jgi:hypothetical protein
MSDLEVRVAYYSQLLVPNPTEHYKMARSYESMRLEAELLMLCEPIDFTEQIRINEALDKILYSNRTLVWPYFVPLIIVLLAIGIVLAGLIYG